VNSREFRVPWGRFLLICLAVFAGLAGLAWLLPTGLVMVLVLVVVFTGVVVITSLGSEWQS